MPIVQFAPFSSLVQPDFWHELTKLKIDVLRLSDDVQTITGNYSVGRSISDRETGQDIALGCNFTVGANAFEQSVKLPPGSVSASGLFKNYNTIEEFKNEDKTALFNREADKIWDDIISTRNTAALSRFILITYADLKKYKYFYWFAFPAFVSKPAWEVSDPGWKPALGEFTDNELSSVSHQLRKLDYPPFFIVRPSGDSVEIGKFGEFDEFFANVLPASQTIGFIDPSALPDNPGWPLRNLLAYLRALYPSASYNVRVLCWRDFELPGPSKSWKSRFGAVSAADPGNQVAKGRPSAVGWEKNVQGKLGPHLADLAPMMDPKRLADQAVDLNLKLMRWRILPSLDLDKIAATRCLLLGAGTLGCYVARTLMSWGVRTITFVDSARVSFSNPVRQPLFEYEDCLHGGKPKAECAAEHLKRIYPSINAAGYNLSIPMPGHPIPPTSEAQARKDVETLESLFDSHDAIFLLMDSRESRWLPTVMGTAKDKIVMNAALGFDTFLVMRHGARSTASSGTRLGCYYCNDIVAPADSLTDRSLDQMCTVTRPGLASIAASTVVELLVSLLQHPDGVHAPAPSPKTSHDGEDVEDTSGSSVLGLIPHQLRGYLAQFRNIHIVGAAYDRCTGCCETVVKTYETEGFDMLLKAFNDQKYLETLTGLDKLYDEGEAALEAVDWDEDDEDF